MKKFYLLLAFLSVLYQFGAAQLIEQLPDRAPQQSEVINTHQLRTVFTKADLENKWDNITPFPDQPAAVLKGSIGCDASLISGRYGWDLIDVLKATSVDCLDGFMLKDYSSIKYAFTYNSFQDMYMVLDEIQRLAVNYNGVNDQGLGQLIYFVRSYLYWTWTESELKFSGEDDPLYQKIISTLLVVSQQMALYTSKDASNAPVLEQFLIAIDFQQPLSNGEELTYRGQFLEAVVKTFREISSAKLLAIEDMKTRKAFLSAYSRINFFCFVDRLCSAK